jgi:hypothetical protein
MFDQPIPLFRAPFRMSSSDATLQVTSEGGRFVVSGHASGDGELELAKDSAAWEATYATGSSARAAVERLESAVQSDVMLLIAEQGDAVTVRPIETISPAAPLPRVVVLTGDAGLLVRPRAVNQVELRGVTDERAVVTLRVDKHAVALPFQAGVRAVEIAQRLARAVPYGYRADADGGVLTIWRDAKSVEIAA